MIAIRTNVLPNSKAASRIGLQALAAWSTRRVDRLRKLLRHRFLGRQGWDFRGIRRPCWLGWGCAHTVAVEALVFADALSAPPSRRAQVYPLLARRERSRDRGSCHGENKRRLGHRHRSVRAQGAALPSA